MKVTGIEIVVKVRRREWIRVTSGWEEDAERWLKGQPRNQK